MSGTREAGTLSTILLFCLLVFVVTVLLVSFFVVAVKELVEVLLEVVGPGPISGAVHSLFQDLFVLPRSLHHSPSQGLTFTHVGPV